MNPSQANQSSLLSALGGYAPNLYAGLGGGALLEVPQIPLTDRERLNSRLASNQQQIERLTKENEDIAEALRLLDEHPIIERLNNLVRKLLGR